MKLEEASVFVAYVYRKFNWTEKEKLALEEAFNCLQKGISSKPLLLRASLQYLSATECSPVPIPQDVSTSTSTAPDAVS